MYISIAIHNVGWFCLPKLTSHDYSSFIHSVASVYYNIKITVGNCMQIRTFYCKHEARLSTRDKLQFCFIYFWLSVLISIHIKKWFMHVTSTTIHFLDFGCIYESFFYLNFFLLTWNTGWHLYNSFNSLCSLLIYCLKISHAALKFV